MPRSLLKPALFFDFDNTLIASDLLDDLIECYSPNQTWRDWEHAWDCGRMAARECLQLQVENMRVSRDELLERVARTRIDPAFAELVDWAGRHNVPVNIVSDSFAPLIGQILAANGLPRVPVFANELAFRDPDRLIPSFPHHDPEVACSANAKARHLAPFRDSHCLIFAGDGHSDLDAALAADIVFAKSTLARELDTRGVAFYPFETVEPVLVFLESVPIGTWRDAEQDALIAPSHSRH